MRRLGDDRGAVAIMVALLMGPLIGFAAITVDVAGMWSEQQQLQTGADAGALAVAQYCAHALVTASSACGSPTSAQSQTAQSLAAANINGVAAATITNLTPNAVTVRNQGVHKHLFAPVLGFGHAALAAKATAGWGAPYGGTAVLPLVFGQCEFLTQAGGGLPSSTTEYTIFFTKTSSTSTTSCPIGPSGNATPGGFAWVNPDSGTCNVTSTLAQTLASSTGASVPSGCSATNMQQVQNKTVLLPLFDSVGAQGTAATYHIYGYAAFTLTGYNFPSKSFTWNASNCLSPSVNCIKGYFSQFVDLASAFTYAAPAGSPVPPQLGAAIVSLSG